jgi:hypothetical protein
MGKKRGRPPKSPGEKMTWSRFGMTAAELELLNVEAERRDVSLSYLVRAVGTAATQSPELIDQAISDLDSRGSAGAAIPSPTTDT